MRELVRRAGSAASGPRRPRRLSARTRRDAPGTPRVAFRIPAGQTHRTGAPGMSGPDVPFRRLIPDNGTVTAVEAVDGLEFDDPGHRPYLVLNMVATVDGAAA